ncbi:AAEL005134-PB [Aedes aegypti]|uniref:Sulfatase N-terminal domain-containing protein n=2 Tax=Aedes aegypti TaxID=7159 RepID=A0A8W7IX06_AEDAE|nr:arylsulfatase B isoform X2 [Aedes aegypti]XP_021711777.1 arylsulfatase B-like isoform X2 [Aedes aegypti]EAT43411.1 AAEL005134-PB [Aedes aegypti]
MLYHLISVLLISALLLLAIPSTNSEPDNGQRPHIVIIMADDMGWNDVGFHGSNQIPTPNIDALAYDGIILNRHYTAPMCTPSRASLMTGKNPINIGMQHYVIVSDEPWGLGLDQKIMPEYFKEAGYRTHLVGKWHLGFSAKQYTPTMRGFDTHVGYLGPYVDYWDYTLKFSPPKSFQGYDMRNNLNVDYDSNGTYATDHFTKAASSIIERHDTKDPLFLVVNHLAPHAANDDDPLQAPEEDIRKFDYISDERRRIYAAMVSKLDDSVGQIFNSLRSKNMLDNSIILFMSDNGAPTAALHANTGSNYPLRGIKSVPWEAATRCVAAIWSPLLQERQRVSNQFIHISDWLPTLASAAGIDIPFSKDHSEIDGQDQWEALSYDTGNPRRVVLNMIDEIYGYSSYMENGFKFVNGTYSNGSYDGWYGQPNTSDQTLSDDQYIDLVLQTEITRWAGETISRDTIKYLRKHARVNCNHQPEANKCNPLKRPCLFDIINDPCELNDLSHKFPMKFRELRSTVQTYRRLATKPRNKPADPAANPANFGGVWTWWRPDQTREELIKLAESELDDRQAYLPIPPPHSSLPEDVRLPVQGNNNGFDGTSYRFVPIGER